MARRLMGVLLVVVVAAALVVALTALFQRRLIYLAEGDPGDPAFVGLPEAREVTFDTEDGLSLNAWFVPAHGESPSPGVAFFPGNGGNRSYRAPLAAKLAAAGLSVLLVDYRGYAGNPGSPSETGLASDARAAATWLRRQSEVDPERLIYFGESLGTGVAVTLATESPPAALILRSPYSSLTSLAQHHYPFLPVRWILQDRFESHRRIGALACPILVLAGDLDRIVPTEESHRLFEAASEPKRLVLIPAARHNDPQMLDGALLLEEVHRFLQDMELIPTPPPRRPLE
jgi:fermentation-respiration switch protein FrsA (DUF1100 family)